MKSNPIHCFKWDVLIHPCPKLQRRVDEITFHDDVIKWKHYWPFVKGIHRAPVNSSNKGQWRRALIFFLWSAPEQTAQETIETPVIYDVTLMWSFYMGELLHITVVCGCNHLSMMVVGWGGGGWWWWYQQRRSAQQRLLGDMSHGPLTRFIKLRVAHAPGMPGPCSPPPRISDPDMHHDTCVTHVPWCMPGSLTSDFLWSRWRGKRSRHSRRKGT